MKLIFVTEARFQKGEDGKIYSQNGSYGLPLWERYLAIFDTVKVIARVENTKSIFPSEYIAESEYVTFVELPYFIGPWEYIKRRRGVNRILKKMVLESDAAYICRVPGKIGSKFASYLWKNRIPFAVEVVGDPWDVFAPGNVKHVLSTFFRIVGYWSLKKVVRQANASLYVTKNALQNRYPSNQNAFTTYASNVFISDSSFVHSQLEIKKGSSEVIELIAIGSLAQMYKAPDIVIESLSTLRKKGYKFHLRWLGDGVFKKPMIEYVKKLNLCDNIKFVGNISSGDPVRTELKKSDIFIHVSRTEGLPRAMIEAMSLGLPCIGTKVGGIPELLGKTALISPDNAEELTCKIEEFILNPNLMRTESIRNYEVAKDYSDSILKNRRKQFYNQIIKRSKG